MLAIMGVLLCQANVTSEIRKAILLFQNNIFPSLFPFMVLSPFFIHYGFFDVVKKYLGPIFKKLFHISESASYLFFMSIISGFPNSATNAKNLYEENLISKEEAFHTLLFSHFSNPIFIFSMVPSHPRAVLFAHYFSNVIIGLVLRPFTNYNSHNKVASKKKERAFFEIFSDSIRNAIQSSLFILGVIVFFFMVSAVINVPISRFLLELSQGLAYTNSLAFSPKIINCLQAFLLSFGGFSVHIQTYGILSDWKIPYFPYFITRIMHGVLASFIALILI